MSNRHVIQVVYVFTLVVVLLSGGCSKSENPTEPQIDKALVGNWKLTEMSSEIEGVVETFTESLLDSMGLVWTLKMEDDGSIVQITNISGILETMPGTWKTSSNQLTLTLNSPGGGKSTIVYDYVIDGNILKLNWDLTAGTKFYSEFTRQ